MQYGLAAQYATLDAVETAWGASPLLRFYSGAAPANCGTAASGTKLAEGSLPADPMAAASGSPATKVKQGTWTATGVAAGTIGYYRIYDSTGTTCHEQGTCAATGTPDMSVDNAVVAVSQLITVTTYTKAAGNA